MIRHILTRQNYIDADNRNAYEFEVSIGFSKRGFKGLCDQMDSDTEYLWESEKGDSK